MAANITATQAATITPIVHGCSWELDDDIADCWSATAFELLGAAWDNVESEGSAVDDSEPLDEADIGYEFSVKKEMYHFCQQAKK
jgi:hypothetical protein